MGLFGVKFLKFQNLRKVYQNDALGHGITLKWLSRSPERKYGVFDVNWGKNIKYFVT